MKISKCKINNSFHLDFLNFLKIFLIFLISSCDFTPKVNKNILKAQEFIKNQEYDKAIYLYEASLKFSLKTQVKNKILFQLGDLYLIHKSDFNKSLDYFMQIEKVQEQLSLSIKAEEKIADLNYTYLRNFQKASDSYKRLINFEPRLKKYDYFNYHYSLSLHKLGNLEEAKKTYLKAIKENSSYKSLSQFQLALMEFEKNNWDQAIKDFNKFISLSKNDESLKHKRLEARYLIANCYESKEDLIKSYNLYNSLLRVYPNTDIVQKKLDAIYKRKMAIKR